LLLLFLQKPAPVHDRILLSPHKNSGEELAELQDALTPETSPAYSPRSPERRGKTAVSALSLYLPLPFVSSTSPSGRLISSRSSARLQEASEVEDHAFDLVLIS
jgi:hypothetical protein